jgi:hypothetical protein
LTAQGLSADELLELLDPLPLTPSMESYFEESEERRARVLSPNWLTRHLRQ